MKMLATWLVWLGGIPWMWALCWFHNLITGPYQHLYSWDQPWWAKFPLFFTCVLLLAGYIVGAVVVTEKIWEDE